MSDVFNTDARFSKFAKTFHECMIAYEERRQFYLRGGGYLYNNNINQYSTDNMVTLSQMVPCPRESDVAGLTLRGRASTWNIRFANHHAWNPLPAGAPPFESISHSAVAVNLVKSRFLTYPSTSSYQIRAALVAGGKINGTHSSDTYIIYGYDISRSYAANVVGGRVFFEKRNDGVADFSARYNHAMITWGTWTGEDNYPPFLITGGQNSGTVFDDAWLSSDGGIRWSQINDACEFGARSEHAMIYGFPTGPTAAKIYVVGGRDADGAGLADIWASEDGGYTWELLLDDAPFGPRVGHKMLKMGSYFYLVGGIAEVGGDTIYSDLWRSSDMETWTQYDSDNPIYARYGHSLSYLALEDEFVYDNYLVGGVTITDGVESGACDTYAIPNKTRYTDAHIIGSPKHFLSAHISGAFDAEITFFLGGTSPHGPDAGIASRRFYVRRYTNPHDGVSQICCAQTPGNYLFVPKYDGSIISFDGDLYAPAIMGDGGGYEFDDKAWKSSDNGATWERTLFNAQRNGSHVFVFDGHLCAVGHDIDLNGMTYWSGSGYEAGLLFPITASRCGSCARAVVHGGDLYIIGGWHTKKQGLLPSFDCIPNTDVVTMSTIGGTQTVFQDVNLPPRFGHCAFSLGDYIYVAGGYYYYTEDGVSDIDDIRAYSDLWRSEDGETWEQVEDSGVINGGSCAIYDSKAYILNGTSGVTFDGTSFAAIAAPTFQDSYVWQYTGNHGKLYGGNHLTLHDGNLYCFAERAYSGYEAGMYLYVGPQETDYPSTADKRRIVGDRNYWDSLRTEFANIPHPAASYG